MNFCTDYNFLNGLVIVKYFYRAALIILPIVIIIMGSIDGFKAVTSGKDEDLKAILFNTGTRAASFFIIMLLPTIIHIAFNFIDGYDGIYNNLTICMNNADPKIIAGLKRAREKELKGYEATTRNYLAKYNANKYTKRNTVIGATQVSGKGNFVKYNLSDSELAGIASLCIQEQGTVQGAAAEASLMANLYELQGGGYSDLYSYVRNSGWFANSEHFMDNPTNVTEELKAAVKTVLVDGKRTLPAYINEHDYLGDIAYVENDGASFDKTNLSGYQQYKTKVHQAQSVGQGVWTFYSFPAEGSDPFGYTSEENRQRLGEDCYSFSQITTT